jgi:hypothetical protein
VVVVLWFFGIVFGMDALVHNIITIFSKVDDKEKTRLFKLRWKYQTKPGLILITIAALLFLVVKQFM